MAKARLDDLLVQKGFAEDRKEALALILGGQVLIVDQRADKPGMLVDSRAPLRLKGARHAYVSRGGLKLEAALQGFGVSVRDSVCLDLGASTGGFTDCLLQHGARRVHAFDVGKGQIDWKLRTDSRVVVHDGFNVRYLELTHVGETVDLITLDLSFISLRKVLPVLKPFAPVSLIALVKPQFEAERSEVGPGGLILSSELQQEILNRVKEFAARAGFRCLGDMESPVPGQKGNREFLLYLSLE